MHDTASEGAYTYMYVCIHMGEYTYVCIIGDHMCVCIPNHVCVCVHT